MKIVVMDVTSLSGPCEREFVLPVVKFGRDNTKCHIVFDRATWPMVSRDHCEIRMESGKCRLFDRGSTFGTFLNSQRVKGSAEVRSGALVQFGAGGPVLRIQSFEPDAQDSQRDDANKGLPLPSETQAHTASKSEHLAALELLGEEENSTNTRVQLNSETTLLGRDPASAFRLNLTAVSRRHAEIRRSNGQFVLFDLGSYNGTILNGQRIDQANLYHNDRIQLGANGPTLRLIDPANPALNETNARRSLYPPAKGNGNQPPLLIPPANLGESRGDARETLVAAPGGARELAPLLDNNQAPPFLQRGFTDKPYISVGRAPDNDIRLDSLQVSVRHARFIKDQNRVFVEDKGSTNGVYINGNRITPGRKEIKLQDLVQVGPFQLQVNSASGIDVFDTRSKTRIDAVELNRVVSNGSGRSIRLLDEVHLTIQPNEFVGLLGESGAGKSTLMNALNGMAQPTGGQVLINNMDLYRHLDSLKHSIGYVPQDDIIHRELSVYRTLFYVARLRLPRDVSRKEIDQIISEVLDVTGLEERRDVPIERLSGGQRKRVSIAVELITKPSIIFLDEPTSGLDPSTEEKIMKLFRRIAESGRTVVLTTHATANVNLFDKIVVLMGGKVVFYGKPAEALAHFNVSSFKDLFDALKTPGVAGAGGRGSGQGSPAKELSDRGPEETGPDIIAEEWRNRYRSSELYQRNVVQPQLEINPVRQGQAGGRPRMRFVDLVCQWMTLVRRYTELLARDRMTLLVLFGQAPVIALLIYLVINDKAPRDFPYFMLSLVAMWFGTSVAAREIIRERPVYNRERMVNLRLLAYIGSKITILGVLILWRSARSCWTLKVLHFAHLTYLPGRYGGLQHLLVMILTGIVGIALGLLVSAVVRTSETATSLVPLLLIPQILFSGMAGLPKGVAKFAGAPMPVTWSFDQMKRYSTLETLNNEGSIPKYMEGKAREETDKAQEAFKQYDREVNRNVEDYSRRVEQYLIDSRAKPDLPRPQPARPAIAPQLTAAQQNDDLKNFVTFTHPWGGPVRNLTVLVLILLLLIGGTLMVLRLQDKG